MMYHHIEFRTLGAIEEHGQTMRQLAGVVEMEISERELRDVVSGDDLAEWRHVDADGWLVPLEDEQDVEDEDDIKALREEAAAAGDEEQVRLCELALAGDSSAIAACIAAINDAAAQDD